MIVSILAKIFDKCFVFSNSPDPLCYCLIPHYSTLKIQLTSLNQCENFSNRCRTSMCWRSVLESHINTIGKKKYISFLRKNWEDTFILLLYPLAFRNTPGHEWANKSGGPLCIICMELEPLSSFYTYPLWQFSMECFLPSSDHSTYGSLCLEHSVHI